MPFCVFDNSRAQCLSAEAEVVLSCIQESENAAGVNDELSLAPRMTAALGFFKDDKNRNRADEVWVVERRVSGQNFHRYSVSAIIDFRRRRRGGPSA